MTEGTSTLALPNPFSIQWTADHIRTSSYGAPYSFVSETRFRRMLKMTGAVRLVEYSLEPEETTGGHLRIALLNDPASKRSGNPADRRIGLELIHKSRFVFGMDDDLAPVYAGLNEIPQIRGLLRRYCGLRLVKAPDLCEALLIAILGQQVSVASAQSQRRRLMMALGERIRFNGQEYFGIPGPDRLADTGESGLRKLGVSRQKSRYLAEMAKAVVSDGLSLRYFDGEPCERVIERLMEIPGVGRWTAEIVAMRGLGFLDVFPAGDLGLQVAVQQVFKIDHRPSEKELRDLAHQWKGCRSYAALYLWMTLMEGGYA